jgi:hypothetical protein
MCKMTHAKGMCGVCGLRGQLQILVADVVRHLMALDSVIIYSDFGILSNSAKQKSSLDNALVTGWAVNAGNSAGLILGPFRNESYAE